MLLPELTNVVLTAPIEQGRHKLPVGAAGIIMSVFPKTDTYTIEFFEPSCVIPAVGKDMVKPEPQLALRPGRAHISLTTG